MRSSSIRKEVHALRSYAVARFAFGYDASNAALVMLADAAARPRTVSRRTRQLIAEYPQSH